MNTDPYTIVIPPEIDEFIRRLNQSEQAELTRYIDLIANRRILPDLVDSIPNPKTYKVRIPTSELSRQWPQGLRIFFTVKRSTMTVRIVDIGDHTTSALYPGESIYPDER